MDMLKTRCGNRIAFSWGRPSPDEQREIANNMVNYWAYCEDFVAKRAAEPVDDFTSDLIRIHQADPEALSLHEITNVAYGLSFAGHETTTNFTSNAIRQLLSHREQWDALCADRSLINEAVEEVLRFDSSIVAWRRITTSAVEVEGVTIPAEAKVLLLLGAANRDPKHFTEPETFDIQRNDVRAHIAFGKGIHYCIGAALAHMEARIALDLLAQRLGHEPGGGPGAELPRQHLLPRTQAPAGRLARIVPARHPPPSRASGAGATTAPPPSPPAARTSSPARPSRPVRRRAAAVSVVFSARRPTGSAGSGHTLRSCRAVPRPPARFRRGSRRSPNGCTATPPPDPGAAPASRRC